MLNRYRKTIVAVVGAAVAWSGVVLDSGPDAITGGEWRLGGILLATALGVYGVANQE